MSQQITPFESIRRTNPAGNEFWSSGDFAKVLDYADYRNFQSVIESSRTACFNSGQREEDHFVEVTDMIEVGKGARRPAKTVMMSRYACYLEIANKAHRDVGAKVRQTIKELGGTMPEELPPWKASKNSKPRQGRLSRNPSHERPSETPSSPLLTDHSAHLQPSSSPFQHLSFSDF
jgi:DNA-damage-inducible protein D